MTSNRNMIPSSREKKKDQIKMIFDNRFLWGTKASKFMTHIILPPVLTVPLHFEASPNWWWSPSVSCQNFRFSYGAGLFYARNDQIEPNPTHERSSPGWRSALFAYPMFVQKSPELGRGFIYVVSINVELKGLHIVKPRQ